MMSNISQLLPLFDTDHLEVANCLPPPQARNMLNIFLRNNNNRIRQSSTSRLPDFCQKDAHFIKKLHIHSEGSEFDDVGISDSLEELSLLNGK